MVYNRFRRSIVIRVIVLSISVGLESWLFLRTEYIASTIVLGALIVYQVVALIHFTETTRRELAQFLDSIRYEDFIDNYPQKRRRHEEELNQAFSRIVRDFQLIRTQREEQFRYIETIIHHVSIGILCFDSDGHIDLLNTAAKRLLRVFQLKNIHDLDGAASSLIPTFTALEHGQRLMVNLDSVHDRQQLMISATVFQRNDKQFTLVSLQDIHNLLEEKEMDAWQNLMRVLTHEIRNSITPIASLAGTAEEMLTEYRQEVNEHASLEDIYLAVDTIHKRSKGLLKFTEDFRSIYQIPRPSFQIVSIKEMFGQLKIFFNPRIESQRVAATFQVEPDSLEITADRQLLEQALINLTLNALDAVKDRESPVVEFKAYIDHNGDTIIDVSDNGPGILPEVLDRIFIPFFTTKKEGSGIGLALCRQIMRLHRGTIQVHSEQGQGAVFRLRF